MTSNYLDEIDRLKQNISLKEKEIKQFELQFRMISFGSHLKISKKIDENTLQEVKSILSMLNHEANTMRRELSELQKHVGAHVDNNNSGAGNEPPRKPPFLAEIITRLVTKPSLRDRVLGSREERFHRDLRDRSEFKARAIYWGDTIASCWPGIKRLSLWLLTGDAIRRWFGS